MRTMTSDDWWGELDGPVLDYLARRGAASPDEIARAVGLTPASVTSIIAMLAGEGRLRIARVELQERMGRAAA